MCITLYSIIQIETIVFRRIINNITNIARCQETISERVGSELIVKDKIFNEKRIFFALIIVLGPISYIYDMYI